MTPMPTVLQENVTHVTLELLARGDTANQIKAAFAVILTSEFGKQGDASDVIRVSLIFDLIDETIKNNTR